MSKDSLSSQMLGALEETKIRRLTRIAAIGRNGFVDEREEVTVEGRGRATQRSARLSPL
jgi:hypothetical protein